MPAAATSCIDAELGPGKHTYTGDRGLALLERDQPDLLGESRWHRDPLHDHRGHARRRPSQWPTTSRSPPRTKTRARSPPTPARHSLVFSGAASSPSGTAPTVSNNVSSGNPIAFGSQHRAHLHQRRLHRLLREKRGVEDLSGAASIVATEGSLTTPDPLDLVVTAGTATKYTLAAANDDAGGGRGRRPDDHRPDAYGNTATAYTGSHNIVFSGAARPQPRRQRADRLRLGRQRLAFGTPRRSTSSPGWPAPAAAKTAR